MTHAYTLTEENRNEFAGIYLLEHMVSAKHSFDVVLNEADADLEPILMWLMVKDYVEIRNEEHYVPSAKGRECVGKFLDRYAEFLTMFDVFSAVDLAEGTFAFGTYFTFENEDDWHSYLDDERGEDLRIAVAEFKGMNPVEVVFMSLVAEDRFGRDATGWQFDLLLGSVWDDVLEICSAAIHDEDLAYEDDNGPVSGNDVLCDVIKQGVDLMISLLAEEDEMARPIPKESNGSGRVYPSPERRIERLDFAKASSENYQPYRDPYYVSPTWQKSWLL